MIRLSLALIALCLLQPGGIQAGNPAVGTTGSADTRLQAISFSRWDEILEAQHGSITVVDFWASWCLPCIERFPHMVEMHHRYQAQGVHFISLNLDEAGDAGSIDWANEFLQRIEAVFPNYHMDENMSEAFERLDLLGLPVVKIYDREGRQAYRLSGDNPNKQFTEKDVEDAVLELLEAEHQP